MLSKFSSIVALLWCGIVFTSAAQKPFKEGMIRFGIEYLVIPDQIKDQQENLPKKTTIYVKDHLSRVEGNIMGMEMISIHDEKTEQSTVLMNLEALGQKIGFQPKAEDRKKIAERTKIKPTKETKKILDYKCKKYVIDITDDGGNTSSMVAYVSEDVAGTNGIYHGLKGMALEYELIQSGMKMRFTALEMKPESVSADKFTVPTDYQMMEADELMQMFGQ